jgi:hypothetical protein
LETDFPKFIDQDFGKEIRDDIQQYLPPHVKSRKLNFALMPPEGMESPEELVAYQASIDSFLQFLLKGSKTCSGTGKVEVIVNETDAANSAAPPVVVKCYVSKGGIPHVNPKWIYIRLDGALNIRKTFHLHLHWLVCDSWLIEDWVGRLFNQCKKTALKLLQTPEFFCTSNMQVVITSFHRSYHILGYPHNHVYQIHPFRTVPTVEVPFANRLYYNSCVLTVEELYLKDKRSPWLEDGMYLTDWRCLGLAAPSYIYSNESPEAKPCGESEDGKSVSSTRLGVAMSALSSSLIARQPRADGRVRRTADRQYIHCNGYASVRLGPACFLWMPNIASRLTDSSITMDERRGVTRCVLHDLERACLSIGLCRDILLDVIEDLLLSERPL